MPRSLPYAGLVFVLAVFFGTVHLAAQSKLHREYAKCRIEWSSEPLCRSLVYGEDMPKRIDMRRAN